MILRPRYDHMLPPQPYKPIPSSANLTPAFASLFPPLAPQFSHFRVSQSVHFCAYHTYCARALVLVFWLVLLLLLQHSSSPPLYWIPYHTYALLSPLPPLPLPLPLPLAGCHSFWECRKAIQKEWMTVAAHSGPLASTMYSDALST